MKMVSLLMPLSGMWSRTLIISTRNLNRFAYVSRLLEKARTKERLVQAKSSTFVSYEIPNKSTQEIVSNLIKNNTRLFLKISRPPAALNSQSVVLPGTDGVRASGIVEDPWNLTTYPDPDTQTVYDVILRGITKTETGECLGVRSKETGEYEWISYNEVNERKKYVGSGVIALGIEPGNKSLVGINTKNRPEFVLTMLGCSSYSMVLVPLYDSFGSELLSYIIAEGEMEVIICETMKHAHLILGNIAKYPHLKHVVVIEATEEEVSTLKRPDVNVLTFSELEAMGKANVQEEKIPRPDDLFAICYTSGTTGTPKGAMVTHKNVVSCMASLKTVFGHALPKCGTLLSYLPCAHIYEIINEVLCLYYGGRLGFYSGESKRLIEDLSVLKPTILPLVPKMMNSIYSAVKRNIMPHPVKRFIYEIAVYMKERDLKKGIISRKTFWDKLMFSRVQEFLGGRAELIFTAAAPVSKDVMRFFRCASGCLVFEAYGQSEVCAATITLMSEHDSGFVGPPVPSNHIKLVDVPELGYRSKDDVGEICIQGTNVFRGYFKNDEATKEAIDEQGWHHTGDIGRWLPNGALSIIDRKKHIFKLAQGEYIAPEKSENVYIHCHLLSQIYVDGNSDEHFVVAIAVPEKEPFMKWAKEQGFPDEDFESLCQRNDVRQAVLKRLLSIGKKRELNSLHQIGNLHLHPEPFTVENGLLTPTMKLRRPVARKHFSEVFKDLYREGSLRKQCNLDL